MRGRLGGMTRPPTPWRYYGGVLWNAHRFSREKWEGLLFLVGEVAAVAAMWGPKLHGWVGDQFDWYLARHPSVPLVVFGVVFLVAVGRENWKRVNAKDVEIAKWRRDTSDTYKQLVEVCRVVDMHLLAGQPERLSDEAAVAQWVEIAKGLRGPGMLTATLTLLTEGEKLTFSLIEVNGIPNNWGQNQEHRLHYFTLKHIRRLLLKAVKSREPPMGWEA